MQRTNINRGNLKGDITERATKLKITGNFSLETTQVRGEEAAPPNYWKRHLSARKTRENSVEMKMFSGIL